MHYLEISSKSGYNVQEAFYKMADDEVDIEGDGRWPGRKPDHRPLLEYIIVEAIAIPDALHRRPVYTQAG